MTLTEAAAVLQVQPATLRRQIAKRKLTATKRGRDWWVLPSEVERYRRESSAPKCQTCGRSLYGVTSHRHGWNGPEEVSA